MVWTSRSKKIGLIDEIGGLDKSLEYLNEKLELNNNYQLISYPEKRSWQVELINQLSGAKLNSNLTDKETLLKMIWEENTELQLREILKNPHQIYSILPYKLNIK